MTTDLYEQLNRIEDMLRTLLHDREVKKQFYSTAEVAQILGKAEFTVREWARLNRINADKRQTGRGTSLEWMISYEELQRIRNEGLLPDPRIIRRGA